MVSFCVVVVMVAPTVRGEVVPEVLVWVAAANQMVVKIEALVIDMLTGGEIIALSNDSFGM